MERLARRSGGAISGLATNPTGDTEILGRWALTILDEGTWFPIRELLTTLRGHVAKLSTVLIPTVGASVEALTATLESLNVQLDAANRRRIEVHSARQLRATDIASLEQRIASLKEDMQKNQDVQKLQRFAGGTETLTPDRCPTCEQGLVDALMSQGVLDAVMPIADNIEYIRSQLKMFEDILVREQAEQRKLEEATTINTGEINALYGRIRTVRSDLTGPTSALSASAVEERVRTEARIRDLETLIAALGDAEDRLQTLASELRDLRSALDKLPNDKMSKSDLVKLTSLEARLRRLAQEFGFSTFPASELTIDGDSYRPQKEGYEIGFETSASDAIRLKWAYQLGLLELSQSHSTNHPGMLLLDEPRQQSSSKISFGALLENAAAHRQGNQQVIVSTSEDLETLAPIIERIQCKRTIFKGYVLQPLSSHGSY